MDDGDGGPWGVYEIYCSECWRKIVLVATVASIEGGYAEGARDAVVCMACRAVATLSRN